MRRIHFQTAAQKKSDKDLRSALNNIKAGRKWEYLLDRAVVDGLKEDFEKYRYQRKLDRFKKEYNKYTSLIGSYENGGVEPFTFTLAGKDFIVPGYALFWEDINTMVEKRDILETLIKLTEQYIATGNSYLRYHIELLEFYIRPLDFISFTHIANSGNEHQMVSEQWNDFISRRIRKRINFKFNRICQDLRLHFRTIIKFLFKNMDDESGDSSLFTSNAVIRFRSQINYLNNEQNRNIRTFTRAA